MFKSFKLVGIVISLFFLLTYEIVTLSYSKVDDEIISDSDKTGLNAAYEYGELSTDTEVISSDAGLIVNDKIIVLEEDLISINDEFYISIKILSEVLDVEEFTWDEETKEANILVDGNNIKIINETNCIIINDINYYTEEAPIMIEEVMYTPVSFFSNIMGVEAIDWDEENNNLSLTKEDITVPEDLVYKKPTSNTGTTQSAPMEHTDDDLLWLAKIVQAESGSESYEGKLAVANVIINRKNSSLFPNSIYGVIFDNASGVQFSPSVNGAINNTPSAESTRAAQDALDGKNNIGNCLYFVGKNATSSWAAKNRTFYTIIGGHAFYL